MRVWVEATATECLLEVAPLGSGGEATVHAVIGQPGLAAKLYRKPVAEHAAKLAAMIAAPPADLGAK
jgi:DNA-binding helix-hairpin-helix protein with protein kinase domain